MASPSPIDGLASPGPQSAAVGAATAADARVVRLGWSYAQCTFTLEHYRRCLQSATDLGFVCASYDTFDRMRGTSRFLLLRHDVDDRLDHAVSMAEVEAELGIRASYFIRMHAPGYSVTSAESELMLRRIHNLGHEIGLHTETADMAATLDLDPLDLLRRELALLRRVSGAKVVSAASHGDFTRYQFDWIAAGASTRGGKAALPTGGAPMGGRWISSLRRHFGQAACRFLESRAAGPVRTARQLCLRAGLSFPEYGLPAGWGMGLFAIVDLSDYGLQHFSRERRFVKDFHHVGDGGGNWAPSCLCQALRRYRRIQLVTHPQYWFRRHYHLD